MHRKPHAQPPARRDRRPRPHRPVVRALPAARAAIGCAVTDTRADAAGARGASSALVRRCVDAHSAASTRALLERRRQVVVSPGRVARTSRSSCRRARRGLDIVGDIELFAREADAPRGRHHRHQRQEHRHDAGRPHGRGARARACASAATSASRRSTCSSGRPPRSVRARAVLASSSRPRIRCSSRPPRCSTSRPTTWIATRRSRTTPPPRRASSTHCDTAVVNLDDPMVVRMPRPGQRTCRLQPAARRCGLPPADAARTASAWLARRGEPLLPRRRAAARRAATTRRTRWRRSRSASVCGLPRAPMLDVLRQFAGLPHRAQWVADVAACATSTIQGHQRRRDARRGRRPRGPAGADRRRRRQGPGLRAARPRPSAARCGTRC